MGIVSAEVVIRNGIYNYAWMHDWVIGGDHLSDGTCGEFPSNKRG